MNSRARPNSRTAEEPGEARPFGPEALAFNYEERIGEECPELVGYPVLVREAAGDLKAERIGKPQDLEGEREETRGEADEEMLHERRRDGDLLREDEADLPERPVILEWFGVEVGHRHGIEAERPGRLFLLLEEPPRERAGRGLTRGSHRPRRASPGGAP